MVILTGKNETLNLRATSVARLYYRQEFGCDVYDGIQVLLADDVTYESAAEDTAKLAWAMNKADNFAAGLPTPDYLQWREIHKDFEFMDYIGLIVREIAKGFMVIVNETDTNDDFDVDDDDAADIAYLIDAIAVRLGIGPDRLNEYTTQAFLDILKIYTENAENTEEDHVRIMTPEDVDSFWR